MECLTDLKNKCDNIKIGDVLVYSKCSAYLILYSDTCDTYFATQIFNNGNEDLGLISYSEDSKDELINNLKHDFGEPIMVTNIYDLKVEL